MHKAVGSLKKFTTLGTWKCTCTGVGEFWKASDYKKLYNTHYVLYLLSSIKHTLGTTVQDQD